MHAPRRILVPFDRSELSTYALDTATTLARKLGSSIMVFRALRPDESKIEAALAIEEELTRRRAQGAGEIVHEERWGDAAAEIINFAAEIDADLVAMGTHGRTGLARTFMGSVAEGVLRASTCPILTVRRRALEETPAHLLVATDFGHASRVALDYAVQLASAVGAKITLASVFATPLPILTAQTSFVSAEVLDDVVITSSEALERSVEELRARGVPIATTLRQGQAADVICQLTSEVGADLIVLGTHGRGGLTRALLGSVAEQILREASVPVVTLRTAR